MAPAFATYEPRDPSRTVLSQALAAHVETLLASLDADPDARGLLAYVEREFYDYLQCGVLASVCISVVSQLNTGVVPLAVPPVLQVVRGSGSACLDQPCMNTHDALTACFPCGVD